MTTSPPPPPPPSSPSCCTCARHDDDANAESAEAARPSATVGSSACVCVASSFVSHPSAPRIATGRWSKPKVGACAVSSSGCCCASSNNSGADDARIRNCGGDSIVSTKTGGASACFGVSASPSSSAPPNSSDEIMGGGVPRELKADRDLPYVLTSLIGDAAAVIADADPCWFCFCRCFPDCSCAAAPPPLLVLFHKADGRASDPATPAFFAAAAG